MAPVAALSLRTRRPEAVGATLGRRPFLSLFSGVGVLTIVIALFVLLNRLGRWQPLFATQVSLAILLTAVAGYMGLTLSVGRLTARGRSPVAQVAVTAALIAVVQLIPVLGFFALLLFFLLARRCAALSGWVSISLRRVDLNLLPLPGCARLCR